MGSLSLIHWLVVLIIAGVVIYPITIVLKRVGFSRWWALLALVPLVNWFALWAFALARWPMEKKSDAQG